MRQLSVVTATISVAALSGCSAESGIDAEALLESRCSVCHSTSIPKNARKSESEWESTVSRMIRKGARLSPREKSTLVNHLAKKYRP